MYAPILKDRKKSTFTSAQITFNRHRRKIDQLHGRLESLKDGCEQALRLYHSHLKPKEKEAGNAIIEFLLKMMDLTQNPTVLNKKEKEILNEIFKNSLNELLCLLLPCDIPDKIKNLYQKVFGKSFDDTFQDDITDFKEFLKEQTGRSFDEFNFNANDSAEEILKKLAQNLNESPNKKQESELPKQKSKKELLKEKKAQDLEALQSKGLNSIYKRLVKELHPDLEQDLEQREEKTLWMKRLTVAYESQDLLSLLKIESEWLGSMETGSESLNDETLKVFNSLLKEQVEDLKLELQLISRHPRYFEIARYINDFPEVPLEGIDQCLSDCHYLIEEYTSRLENLSGKTPIKTLKKNLSNYNNQLLENDALEVFLEQLDMNFKIFS